MPSNIEITTTVYHFLILATSNDGTLMVTWNKGLWLQRWFIKPNNIYWKADSLLLKQAPINVKAATALATAFVNTFSVKSPILD